MCICLRAHHWVCVSVCYWRCCIWICVWVHLRTHLCVLHPLLARMLPHKVNVTLPCLISFIEELRTCKQWCIHVILCGWTLGRQNVFLDSYRSVPGKCPLPAKRPWVLKRISQFWPTRACTWDTSIHGRDNPLACIFGMSHNIMSMLMNSGSPYYYSTKDFHQKRA